MIVTLEQIERDAMALSPGKRAQLADRLWESVMGNRTFDVVMTRARLSPKAETDLEALFDHIATEEPQAALRVRDGAHLT